MNILDTEIKKLTIVVVGNFNPTLFQPLWLSKKNIIREIEGENANIEIIHPEIVKFSFDWMQFEVTPDRLLAATTDEKYFNILIDLVISIFNILKETPIRAFGINHTSHFKFDNDAINLKFGEFLANLNSWRTLFKDPRLFSYEIINFKENKLGEERIKISPIAYPKYRFGVTINFNDHFDLEKNSVDSNASKFLLFLTENKQKSFHRAKEIFNTIFENFNNKI